MRSRPPPSRPRSTTRGSERGDIDGLSIHIGWPLGVDYDQVAQAFGLEIGFVNQAWTHGRFVTGSLQTAAMAVACGMANVVACVNVLSFTRERDILGGPHDFEGYRETGGTHAETPHYGLTAPAGGAALAMQRYGALYGTTSAELAAVPVALRAHARLNPLAVMRKPMSVADHQASRMVVDPLRLFDCCIVSDGAAVVLVTTAERARDLRQRPVLIAGMQGMAAGRNEFIFAPPGLGINQQATERPERPSARDLAVYRSADIPREAIQGLYTYDAFSPLVLFVLERFGFCAPGEAAAFVQDGRHRPRWRTAGQHLGRPAVGGPRRRLELALRDGAPVAGRRRAAPDRGRRRAAMGDDLGRFRHPAELRGRGAIHERIRETRATDQPGQRALLGERTRGRAPPAPLRRLRRLALAARPRVPGLLLRSDRLGGSAGPRHGLHLDRGPQGLVRRTFKADIPYAVAQDRACGRRAC